MAFHELTKTLQFPHEPQFGNFGKKFKVWSHLLLLGKILLAKFRHLNGNPHKLEFWIGEKHSLIQILHWVQVVNVHLLGWPTKSCLVCKGLHHIQQIWVRLNSRLLWNNLHDLIYHSFPFNALFQSLTSTTSNSNSGAPIMTDSTAN